MNPVQITLSMPHFFIFFMGRLAQAVYKGALIVNTLKLRDIQTPC